MSLAVLRSTPSTNTSPRNGHSEGTIRPPWQATSSRPAGDQVRLAEPRSMELNAASRGGSGPTTP